MTAIEYQALRRQVNDQIQDIKIRISKIAYQYGIFEKGKLIGYKNCKGFEVMTLRCEIMRLQDILKNI